MPVKAILPFFLTSVVLIISCQDQGVAVNNPPVIYDLVAPDSLQIGSPSIAYIFVSATDPDGPGDIDSVYFTSIRPDGTSNGLHFYLHDDGQYGDSVAADGRYTLGITFDSSVQLGIFTFTFSAKDKRGDQSNQLQAFVTAY